MIPEIKELIDSLKRVETISRELDGETIDLAKERIFTKGVFLHQDTENMTEEESARFERENKKIFDFLRMLDDRIGDAFQ